MDCSRDVLGKIDPATLSLAQKLFPEGPKPAELSKQVQELLRAAEIYEQLLGASKDFDTRIGFPTRDNRIEAIAKDAARLGEVARHAITTRPLLHERTLDVLQEFLEHKKSCGTSAEKALYDKMSVQDLIDRLLKKRPLVFMNRSDNYLSRELEEGAGGFEKIGSQQEQEPLLLKDYLSYDEMQLSALINVSVPTHFINDGRKDNRGVLDPARVENLPSGVLVALVGARFEKPGVMEWQHMVVSREQNCAENGFGPAGAKQNPERHAYLKMWADFYGQSAGFDSWEELDKAPTGRYIPAGEGLYLNVDVYKQRMRMSYEPFLLDANARAAQAGKKAFVMAEGIGLGYWRLCDQQAELVLEVLRDLVRELDLSHISTINVSRIATECKDAQEDLAVHFDYAPREPMQILTGEDADKLLVSSFAWDANSYPGNEYWNNGLDWSADPAAACASCIPELQNPEINPMVSGCATWVASAAAMRSIRA